MRKLLFISGFIWATAYLLSVIFRLLHWPGHHALVMGQSFVLGMVLIPAYLMYRLQNQPEMRLRDKLLYGIGGLTSLLVTFGTFFKTFQWPGANVLMISSIWLLIVGFIPLVLWNWYHHQPAAEQVA